MSDPSVKKYSELIPRWRCAKLAGDDAILRFQLREVADEDGVVAGTDGIGKQRPRLHRLDKFILQLDGALRHQHALR